MSGTVKVRTPVKRQAPSVQASRGLGDRFLHNEFKVTDEELREDARVTITQGDPQWDGYLLDTVMQDCALFAHEILSGPPELPYNGHFLLGPHHLEWSELVRTKNRICVLAPRDHGKTYFFDFAFPIWKAIKLRGGSGFIFSATQDQASRILGDIKQELETNPKLQYLVPDTTIGSKGKKWSSTAIQLNNGHRIYARGFGTRVRGAHPAWIVVDDGLNDETAYSEVIRKKQIDYFYMAVSNMCIPGGQIIVAGTPYSENDLYADLAVNEEYTFRRYPALHGEPPQALWPGRYSLEQLEAKKREIGSLRFTREFLAEPVSDDMSLFPGYLFKGAPTEVFTLTLGMSKDIYDRLGVTIFMGVDFAMSSSAAADFTVITVLGVDKWGNRWLIDMKRGKGLPYQTQLSMINELGHKYDPALIFLESNQMQRIFGDELIRTTDLPIKKFITGAQRNTLDKGVPSLRVLLENGKFRIPRGDKASIEMTNLWIDEMRAFTWVDGELKSVGAHDDTVFSMWIADQAIRAGGFSFDFGDDLRTSGSLDKMLQEENAEGTETQATPEEEIEARINNALGIAKPVPLASGDLIDEDAGNPFRDDLNEPNRVKGTISRGNLVDDADADEEEQRRRLLGGAPSAAHIRNYW